MRKTEQKLWDRMRDKVGRFVLLERVENSVSDGHPDVTALYDGLVTMVELKAIEGWPARWPSQVLGSKKGLRLSQRNWLLDWIKNGGRAIILVRVGKELFAVPGLYYDSLNSFTREHFKPFTVTWDDVIDILRSKDSRGF